VRETFYYESRSFEVVTEGDETREKSYINDHFIHTKVTNSAGTSEEGRYLLRDHLNSLESTTDENGAIVHRVGFDSHGRNVDTNGDLLSDTELSAQTLAITTNGFTGHESLIDSGLIHMNGRVYDPVAGRFLNTDPYVQFPHYSQAYNRYSYVLNNPLSYTDPSGEFLPLIWVGVTLAYKAYSAVESASATVDDFKTLASDTASSSEKALSAVSLASNLLGVGTVQRKINGVFKSVNQKKANKKRNNRSNNKAEKPGSSGSDSATEKSGGNKEKSTSDGGEPPGGRGKGSGGGDSSDGAKGGTETVQRAMSRAELGAIQKSGTLSRGGRLGDHHVSDAVNSSANRARQRLALPQTPEVRATLEVPRGVFSSPSKVKSANRMPGGGLERTAPGNLDIPAKIIRTNDL